MEAVAININEIISDKTGICPTLRGHSLIFFCQSWRRSSIASGPVPPVCTCLHQCLMVIWSPSSSCYSLYQHCCVTLFKFCVMPAGIPGLMPAPAVCPRAVAWYSMPIGCGPPEHNHQHTPYLISVAVHSYDSKLTKGTLNICKTYFSPLETRN